LALATTPLVEGVTPSGKKVTVTDYTATLVQYGDFVTLSDVILDTATDPVLSIHTEILGEQAAQTVETLRYNVIKAGTNKFWSNGTARTDVNTPLTTALQRKVTRALLGQNAKLITTALRPTPDYRTEPVEASFIALCHSDVENDIRSMSGYINTKQYGTVTPYENEIGAVENVRYLRSTLFTPYEDGGGAKGAMLSTTGTSADVYPVIYIAKDAYGIVPLRGQNALTPMVVNPKPANGDPLGQRGTVGWKTMQTTLILNDAWMAVAEVAVTA
jgi:N4-gp56 family major capsid protein